MTVTANVKQLWNGREISAEMLEALRDALYASAGNIVSAAKGKVPKATGRLAGTIRRARGKDKKEPDAYVFAGNRRDRIYWHGFVEYGTAKMPAQPYLRPAVDGARSEIISGAKRAARRVINKPRRGA